MKSLLSLFIFSVFLGAGAENLDPARTSLRVLDVSESNLGREILYRDFQVLEDLGTFLVAQPIPSDEVLLKKMQLPSRLVHFNPDREGLYAVSLKGLAPEETARAGRVLHTAGDLALVAGQEDSVQKLRRPVPHYGLEAGIRLLPLKQIKPPRAFSAPAEWKPGTRAADPRIQAMVSQVDPLKLRSTVQDLENMGERKAASGAYTAETYLVNALNAIGGLTVSTHHFSSSYADNVIAELPGLVDPSVIYIVGAHYDSTSYSGGAPGADDNASGTAAVVEIARILSQYDFKYTLRFAAFNAEELGLVGSRAYCDDLVSWGDNVEAMINQDMNCYRESGEPRDVAFITNYSSGALISFCSDMYGTYVPALGITQGTLSGGTSDHQAFTEHGFAACFPFEDLDNYSPYIHTSSDLVDISANDFTQAQMITQGVLAALAELASPLDLEIQHTALGDTASASGPYPVEADVSSLIGGSVAQVTLHYDVGAGYTSKEMVPTGSGDTYLSSIPGRATAGYVKYYLEAVDDQGYTERLPASLEADHFKFFVGHIHDAFADDFEVSDNGWTHGGTGQDDWMRGVPTGNGGYDPGFPASGAMIWGNDLGPSGWNGIYQPNVDNWLESPSIDCTGYTGLFLRYQRWLTVEEGKFDQARILVNGNQVFVNPASGDLIDQEWILHEIDISAHADNHPNVKIRFSLTTDGGKELGGWNIDDLHVGTLSDGDTAALYPSEVYVRAATGGAVPLILDGTGALANRIYVLILGVSGTSPGTQIGSVTVPLNFDKVTGLCFNNLNTFLFDDFLGYLDPGGKATATLNMPVITDPNVVGISLYFAWFTLYPIDHASNPAEILIVP